MACRQQFTVTVGTVLERSHVPLSKWLMALFLFYSSKKSISANQIHRMIGVSIKTLKSMHYGWQGGGRASMSRFLPCL